MLTNDQRAHEMALTMLPKLYDIAVENAAREALKTVTGNVVETHVDMFLVYWDTYEAALEAFNRRFPEN